MRVKNVTEKENAFRQAIWGGIFVALAAFLATEALAALFLVIGGESPILLRYPPDGRILAMFFSSLILSRTILLWPYTIWALRRNIFHIKFSLNKTVYIAIAIALAFTCIINVLVYVFILTARVFPEGGGVVYVWARHTGVYGPTLGPINAILQYLYYVWEGIAMAWIVDAFQTAGEIKGEIKGKKPRVPWGMIALCLFWGLPHLITKGPIGLLWALSFAVIFSALYLKSKKNFWPPFLFWMTYYLAFSL